MLAKFAKFAKLAQFLVRADPVRTGRARCEFLNHTGQPTRRKVVFEWLAQPLQDTLGFQSSTGMWRGLAKVQHL